MTRTPLVDVALAAARRGWHVFPVCPGRKQPPRKAAADWENAATTDPDRIHRWWATHPLDNVAIATGPSGLVVVDLDRPRPGEAPPKTYAGCTWGLDALAQRAAEAGHQLAPTHTVATPSRGSGRHLYYRAPNGLTLRNTAGRIGWKVDTRAHGGYVIAAGSIVNGRPYVALDDTDPAPLPTWLAQLLTPPASPAPPAAGGGGPRPPRPPGRTRGYVEAALTGEVRRVLDAGPGARNEALNLAAWHLGRHVAAGTLPRQLVEDTLTDAAARAGYADGPARAAAVVRNALDARLRRDTPGPG